MAEQSNEHANKSNARSRWSVAVIASIFFFCLVAMALWAFTTLSLVYAVASATPVTVVITCCIVAVDAVAEFFAAVVHAIASMLSAIADALSSIFGG
jgi:hypothetical protein